MPFDSGEQSPCRGCDFEKLPKVIRDLQGSANFVLRPECKECKSLSAYQTSQLGNRHQITEGGACPVGVRLDNQLNVEDRRILGGGV